MYGPNFAEKIMTQLAVQDKAFRKGGKETRMPQVKLHRRVSQRSDAALRSLSALSPTWLWLLMMLFEPAPLIVRDAVYDLGWKYRRAIFGTTTCRKRSEHDLSPNDVKGFGMSR